MHFPKSLILAVLANSVFAHPGADIRAELEEKMEHLSNPQRRSLNSCHNEHLENGLAKRMQERRMAKADQIRAEKGLAHRDVQPFLHHRELESGVENAHLLKGRDEMLFGRQSNCILDPEATEGPYWVSGELIRSDLLEGSKGVVVHLDIEVVNVNTCKPLTDTYVELWGCNSTGVYTGVVAKGNGNGDPREIKNSALRGITKTNATGIAEFVSLVPGHYVGRTNHIHTIIHQGATLLPNNTISGGTITHVGQFYWDQSFLSTVEKSAPYNTNKQTQMQNSADPLLRAATAGGDNPYVQTVLVGSKIEDGIYGYITVGVNPTKSYKPQAVNKWTASGGVPVPGSMWAGYPWTKKEKKSNFVEE